jgi:hypothetical protein
MSDTSPAPKFSYRKGDPARWISGHSYEWRVLHGDTPIGTIYAEDGIEGGKWEAVTPQGVRVGFATPRNAAAKLLLDHTAALAPAAAAKPKRTRKSRTARAAEAAADAVRQPDGEATIVRDAEGLPQITRARDAG